MTIWLNISYINEAFSVVLIFAVIDIAESLNDLLNNTEPKARAFTTEKLDQTLKT